MSVNGVLEVEDLVDGHLEVATLNPAEDLARAPVELLARHHVVEQLRARHEGRLLDEANWGERGDGAGSVSKGDEDATTREALERDVGGRGTDAVDDGLDARRR